MAQQYPSQHLVNMQNKTLKRENEMLTNEIIQLREMYNELKECLDEAVNNFEGETNTPAAPRMQSAATDFKDVNCDTELKEKLKEADKNLNETLQQLHETRKQLSDVQERLTVSEQVTFATQRRELQQEGIYEKLLTQNIYEKLRPDRKEEHLYAKLRPTFPAGSTTVI